MSPSHLLVEASYIPLAFVLAAVKPKIIVDGVPHSVPWGTHVFPVAPGWHHLRIFFPYLVPPEAGPAELSVFVPESGAVRVTYQAPFFVFMNGNTSQQPVAPPPAGYVAVPPPPEPGYVATYGTTALPEGAPAPHPQPAPMAFASPGSFAAPAGGMAPSANGLATAAAVCGISSIFCFPVGIAAVICGGLALSKGQNKAASIVGIALGGLMTLGGFLVVLASALGR